MKKLMFITRKTATRRYRPKHSLCTNRLCNYLLALLIFFVLLSGGINTTFKALESNGNNYIVSSENDLIDAIAAINAGESGEYTITLGADIDVGDGLPSNQLKLEKNSVTIYGENHTLYLIKTCIMVTKNSTLNLGNAHYSKTLSIEDKAPQTGNACEPLITVNNATLNMYNGVTLSGRNGVDTTGGVQLENDAKFNMYGGEISNCRSDSIAGGVLAYNNSQFKMNGGTIKNCKTSSNGGGIYVYSSQCEIDGGTVTDCNSSRSGGGVYVYNSPFKMSSGTIQNCSSTNYGGGVYTNSKFEMTGGTIKGCTNSTYGGAGVCIRTPSGSDIVGFDMSGGEIIDCTSTSDVDYGFGGGILVINGVAQIKEDAKIYNNHASKDGDDIFSSGTNAKLKLGNVPENLILSDTNHEIDGWYVDGVINGENTARWDKDNFAQKYTPSSEELIETKIALKAAHGPIDYNYYNYTVNYYINETLHEEFTQTGKANTVHVDNISAPNNYRIDFIDYINVIEPTSQTPGSFEVNVYCLEPENEEEELPQHEAESNNTVDSLTNEEDTASEQQQQNNNSNNNQSTSPQVPQTGESNLKQCIIFGIFLASLPAALIVIFDK